MHHTLMTLARENDELLESALRATHVGIWEWDILNDTITFSSNIYEMLHIDPDIFEGSIHYFKTHILHPDYIDIFNVCLKEAFNTCLTSKTEYKVIGTDQSEHWVRFDGKFYKNDHDEIAHAAGTLLDITPIKNISKRVSKNFRFLETLIQIIPSPMFYKDAQGYYRYCNHAFSEYIGFPIEQIINHTVYDIAPTDLANVYYQADNELLKDKGVQIYEAEVQYANGDYHDVVFNKTVLLDEHENSMGIVGIMIDITQQKKNQRLIEKQNRVKDILIQVSHSINSYTTEESLNFDLLNRFLTLFENCDNASIVKIIEPDCIEVRSCSDIDQENIKLFTVPLEESYLYKTYKNQPFTSTIIRNVQSYAQDNTPIVDPPTGLMIHESLVIPIFENSHIKYFLCFNSSIKKTFKIIDEKIGHYISEQIPIILQVFNLNQNILKLSRFDNLTGLMNRHYFNETFKQLMENAKASGTQLILVAIDLDDLKGVNDLLGHQAGDDYLKTFSKFITAFFKTEDSFARIGGDEFNGLFSVESPGKVISKLKQAQEDFKYLVIHSNNIDFHGSFSYGVAIFPTDASDIDHLMTLADKRMYENKQENKEGLSHK